MQMECGWDGQRKGTGVNTPRMSPTHRIQRECPPPHTQTCRWMVTGLDMAITWVWRQFCCHCFSRVWLEVEVVFKSLARSSSSAQKQPAFSFFAANPPRSTKSTKTTAGHQIILGHSRFCPFSIFGDMIGLRGSDTFAADTMKCP